jgi:hypothetical protein
MFHHLFARSREISRTIDDDATASYTITRAERRQIERDGTNWGRAIAPEIFKNLGRDDCCKRAERPSR